MRRSAVARRLLAAGGGLILIALQVAAHGSSEQALGPEWNASSGTATGLSLGADVATVTMAPSGRAQVIVSVGYHGGFTSTDTQLRVEGLPPGVSGRFAPHPLTHQGKAVLILEGDGRVRPATYPITIEAFGRDATRQRHVVLEVSEDPGFSVEVAPAMQAMARGGVASYRVSIAPRSGFDAPVSLVTKGLPIAFAASFDPNPVVPGAISTLSLRAHRQSSGRFPFEIVGSSGNLAARRDASVATTAGARSWRMRPIASIGAPINTILVGPGRDDGVNRVYAGTVSTGRVFEVSRNGSGWSTPVDIGGSPNGQEIHNMGMGPGRDDGVTRIYACSTGEDLVELTYQGPGWSQDIIGPPHDECYHALVGDARNDGVQRVYAARGNAVWEYTRRDGQWNEMKLGEVGGVAHGIALGKARGRKTRVYVASTENGTYEATFSNGSWRMVRLGDDGDIRNVSVGRGRRAGKRRVYAATSSGTIREFTWRDGGWASATINEPVGNVTIHAWVAKGRNDGVNRVYTATSDGSAFEMSWTGSRWRLTRMGRAENYLYGMHFGKPGGSGTRLFGGSFDGNVYQFTWR